MTGQQADVSQIAKATCLTRQTIYRIHGNPAASECARALPPWGL